MAVRTEAEPVKRPGRALKLSQTGTVHLEECTRARGWRNEWPRDGVQISVEEIAERLGQGETVGRCCLKPVAERVERTRNALAEIGQVRWGNDEAPLPGLAQLKEMSRHERLLLAAELVRSLEND